MINNIYNNVELCVPAGARALTACDIRGLIMPNEIVVADNINNALTQIQNTILDIESKSCELYNYIEYFGWLGPEPENISSLTACRAIHWEDIDCNDPEVKIVTWKDLLCDSNEDPELTCKPYSKHECKRLSCFGKYCLEWDWMSRNSVNAELPITWEMLKSDGPYEKMWMQESCELNDSANCISGHWHVNIPFIDDFYEPMGNCDVLRRCNYTGIASRDNILYVSRRTTIQVLSSDYNATVMGTRYTIDSTSGFQNIVGLSIDSNNKIFVLDGTSHKVAVFTFTYGAGTPWSLVSQWGGVGARASTNMYRKPRDIYVDCYDNVWVTDTGNNCVKQYTNTGGWIRTVYETSFDTNPPRSLTIDEKDNVHILTIGVIKVYTYTGTFLYQYNIDTTLPPKKINTNYNKQIIYVTYDDAVRMYVRTGIPFKHLIKDKMCVDGINSVYQDEYRNTLVTFGHKIIKYVHILKSRKTKAPLPAAFWSLDGILIDPEEYVQDWVYNKAFQRMWDNIEMFRMSLYYDGTYCKGYHKPKYIKEDVMIGLNEIVTSVTVNRGLGYLWENLCGIISTYYNPNCKEPPKLIPMCEQPSIEWLSNVLINDATYYPGGIWSYTGNYMTDSVARFDFTDNCPPVNYSTINASATALIRNNSSCLYQLSVESRGESNGPHDLGEMFTVYVDGSASSRSIVHEVRGLSGTICTSIPVTYTLTPVSSGYTIQPHSTCVVTGQLSQGLNDNTVITSYHKNAFYEIKLTIA